MLAGYGLVLLMGAGNYLGTRFALSAFLAAAACLSVVWPMSDLLRPLHGPFRRCMPRQRSA